MTRRAELTCIGGNSVKVTMKVMLYTDVPGRPLQVHWVVKVRPNPPALNGEVRK